MERGFTTYDDGRNHDHGMLEFRFAKCTIRLGAVFLDLSECVCGENVNTLYNGGPAKKVGVENKETTNQNLSLPGGTEAFWVSTKQMPCPLKLWAWVGRVYANVYSLHKACCTALRNGPRLKPLRPFVWRSDLTKSSSEHASTKSAKE
jgi:hypothetical protein